MGNMDYNTFMSHRREVTHMIKDMIAGNISTARGWDKINRLPIGFDDIGKVGTGRVVGTVAGAGLFNKGADLFVRRVDKVREAKGKAERSAKVQKNCSS